MSSNITYREALAIAMNDAMDNHENTVIIGQGVADYKGLFGTTSGLTSRYPDRVIETPLAEDSISGICLGMALNGIYPINTHIRADFGLLTFNQLINLAAKYKYMFGGLFEVPMMFRMIIGRSWGQGAQHSQSLQSLLAHIPGLAVIMPSTPDSVINSYSYAINNHKGPVVMLEHRLLYEIEFSKSESQPAHPFFGSHLDRKGSDVTVVCTSIMLLEARRAASYLSEFGISVEIIDLHCISHPDYELILQSVAKTRRLVVADTSWTPYGVAAEVSRLILETNPSTLLKPMVSLGMQPAPCPTAKVLEDMYYPDIHDLVSAICGLCDAGSTPIPEKQSLTALAKKFRGPF